MIDRGSYRIDATETTNAEYSLFLAANPPAASQPPICQWNYTFIPNVLWPIAGKDNMPVTWVDWCDAYSYCAWANKRLCGAIGGGPVGFADNDVATTNQWFAACSENGANVYPYPGSFVATACNGAAYGVDDVTVVGSISTCVTPSGIWDMSGNVYEWEDSCSAWTGGMDVCHARGGSYFTVDGANMRCLSATTIYPRNSVRSTIGFRCCADK
jgi:formylglycine-generating enzyme required for sulfatase activity